ELENHVFAGGIGTAAQDFTEALKAGPLDGVVSPGDDRARRGVGNAAVLRDVLNGKENRRKGQQDEINRFGAGAFEAALVDAGKHAVGSRAHGRFYRGVRLQGGHVGSRPALALVNGPLHRGIAIDGYLERDGGARFDDRLQSVLAINQPSMAVESKSLV